MLGAVCALGSPSSSMWIHNKIAEVTVYMRAPWHVISSDEAASAVEYAMMLALIVVVCIVAITAVGEAAYDVLWDVAESLE